MQIREGWETAKIRGEKVGGKSQVYIISEILKSKRDSTKSVIGKP